MFAEKVIELLKETERNPNTIAPFNEEKLRQILDEMHSLFKMNMNDANSSSEVRALWTTTVQVRHAELERNKRCLLAYLYARLSQITTLRWEFGALLPPDDIRELVSDEEYSWFSRYSANLASYMRSLGAEIGYSGIDLTENLKPPKSLYVEVICLCTKLELDDGDVVVLKKDSRHYLPTAECQTLIRQGVLRQVLVMPPPKKVIQEIKDYEEFTKFVETLPEKTPAYFFFTGKKKENGRTEPIVKAYLEEVKTSFIFGYVDVGDKDYWKDRECPFRTDNQTRLMVIPTIIRWKGVQRLEGSQCNKRDLLQMLFEEDHE